MFKKTTLFAALTLISALSYGQEYSCTQTKLTDNSFTLNCSSPLPTAQTLIVPTTGDPNKGSWFPPNTTKLLIADQSGPTPAYLSSFIPGCLNGLYITTTSGSGCGGNSSYNGFSLGSGKILGLRYIAKPGSGTKLKYFTLASGDGGNVGQSVRMWLHQNPTASFDTTPAACKSISTTQPYVMTGPGYCPIIPEGKYYLFVSTDSTAPNLRYIIQENAADFY